MLKKKLICVGILIVLIISFFCLKFYLNINREKIIEKKQESEITFSKKEEVNKNFINKETAIKIAKSYVEKKYNQKFDEYQINTRLDRDIWIVYYTYGNPPVEGGGGPAVYIKRDNGKVIRCELQM